MREGTKSVFLAVLLAAGCEGVIADESADAGPESGAVARRDLGAGTHHDGATQRDGAPIEPLDLGVDRPPGDPCAQVTCDSPPANKCIDNMTLRTFATTGTCSDGTCSYTSKTKHCLAGCKSAACVKTYGWDYNLKHRCITSRLPSGPNYYSDKTDCPVANKHWFITNNAEKQGQTGTQCTGIQDQALPINAGGPLNLYWQKHTDEYGRNNWIVNLKTDVMNHAHPCGSLVYTFFGVSDFVYFGGGPYPTPDKVGHYFQVRYDDWTPNGASRAIAFFAGEWNGKGVWLELDLASAKWGDAYPAVADIVQVYKSSNFLWVEMYGPAMGYAITRKTWKKMYIPWRTIIPSLISRGYLEAPTGGLQNAKTVGLGLATEVKNNASTGASAEMWVTDWRVSQQ